MTAHEKLDKILAVVTGIAADTAAIKDSQTAILNGQATILASLGDGAPAGATPEELDALGNRISTVTDQVNAIDPAPQP